MVAAVEPTAQLAVQRFLRQLTALLGTVYRDGVKRIANLALEDSGDISGFFQGGDRTVYQFAIEPDVIRFRQADNGAATSFPSRSDSLAIDCPIPLGLDPYGQGFAEAWRRDARDRPQCRIGYSCGDGCISKQDECRIQVRSPRQRRQLNAVRDLAKLVGRLGGKPLLAVLVGIGAAGAIGFVAGSAVGGFVGARGAQRPVPPPPDPPRARPQRDRTEEPIRRKRKPKPKPQPAPQPQPQPSAQPKDQPPPPPAPEADPVQEPPEAEQLDIDQGIRYVEVDRPPVKIVVEAQAGTARMNPNDIRLAPKLFQYKLPNEISAKAAEDLRSTGTTGALRDVDAWNPDLAGKMLVWQVPEDFKANGETYAKGEVLLVHGHHRLALAKRATRVVTNSTTGETEERSVDSVEVEFLAARTTREAKVIGAMQNIAQGAGTARDAASVFRELNLKDSAELKRRGISLKGAIADQGLGLAGLNDRLWGKVSDLSNDEMSLRRAAYIGQIRNDDLQDEVWQTARRRSGATDEYVKSLAQTVQHQWESGRIARDPGEDGGQGALFDVSKVVAGVADRAEVDAYIETQITRESNFWKRAASPTRMAEILARESAGNIDVDRAGEVSDEVAAVRHLYRKGKFLAADGQYEAINQALDRWGLELRALRRTTTSKKRIEEFKATAWQEIRDLLTQGLTG